MFIHFLDKHCFPCLHRHLIYGVFHQCFFWWNSVAGEVLKNMQGRLKYGQNPSEQLKECYLLLVPSVLKTWLAWSDSHLLYLLHLNNGMIEDQFRKGLFSVLQRSKIWSQSLLDHNIYLFLHILVHEPLYYSDSWYPNICNLKLMIEQEVII